MMGLGWWGFYNSVFAGGPDAPNSRETFGGAVIDGIIPEGLTGWFPFIAVSDDHWDRREDRQ